MTGNKVFPPRMPEQLRIAIEKRAEERLRSINNEIVILLKLGLANQYEESEAIKSADKLLAQNKKDRQIIALETEEPFPLTANSYDPRTNKTPQGSWMIRGSSIEEHLASRSHRHRSVENFLVNLVADLIAYTYQPKKPSLNLRDESQALLSAALI